jgi:hypothetical protein
MKGMAAVALTVYLVVLVAILISAYHYLHQLFRHEYQFHREEWEKDGRPGEGGLQPSFRSDFAYMRCSLVWLFHMPEWVREDVTAKQLLSRLRWRVLIWNVGLIVFLPFAVWYIRSTYDI